MSRWMRTRRVARGMRAMKAAGEREHWPAERMREHQAAAVDALVRHAMESAPFWRERFAGASPGARVELAALPPLDKATLMANLDDAVCDERLRGLDLRSLAGEVVAGEFRVMASSGSTGTPSAYVYSSADWTGILAMFFRYNEMIGLRPRVPRVRVAAIGAPSMTSMTQQIADSVAIGLHRVLPLSVADPIPKLVDALNRFRPQAVNAYPSIAALLADEQLAGRLRIAPTLMSTSSELRTAEMTARMVDAWGIRPFDLYAATEGLWGVECEHHDGIHLFEDWCVVENVDRDGRPVPDGQPGERLLVTNLFNRTLPMIRFAVSDVVVIDREPCACGRTLPRMRALQGRSDDVLLLPGAAGKSVPVHPTQFAPIAADPAVREFQVVRRGERLVLRLAVRDGAGDETPARVETVIGDRLRSLGVDAPQVEAEVVASIPRTAAGKLKLVVVEQDERAAAGT